MFNEHGNCVCTCVCMDGRTSVCVCGISKLHLKTARWKEKDQIMTMRRGNWKISTKRYKRDSFFQPTLAGGNFPERGRSWPPILFDPMMLQLYTLCFFFLWSIGDIFSSFETTKIKPRTERTTKIIQKNANLAQLANQKNKQVERLDCRPQVTTIFQSQQQRLAFDRQRRRRRRHRHRHHDHDHVAAIIMLFSLNEPHSGLV